MDPKRLIKCKHCSKIVSRSVFYRNHNYNKCNLKRKILIPLSETENENINPFIGKLYSNVFEKDDRFNLCNSQAFCISSQNFLRSLRLYTILLVDKKDDPPIPHNKTDDLTQESLILNVAHEQLPEELHDEV